MTKQYELLPCPFCGGEAEIIYGGTGIRGPHKPNWAVHCIIEDCIGHDIEPMYRAVESAVKYWNKRWDGVK